MNDHLDPPRAIHEIQEGESMDTAYSCPHCPVTMRTWAVLVRHLKASHRGR